MIVIAALVTAFGVQCPNGAPPPCVRPSARTAPAANTVAVLYFDNLSRDSADTYIADGLTDEVIVRLQQVQRLDVKSRNEVRRYRGTRTADARTLGRELQVAYLVTGSVRPSPSRLRVSYELVRTSDGRSLAANIVDTTAADQWSISNDVALAIAGQVAGRLAPNEQAALVHRATRDAQAIDLFRRGRFLADRSFTSNIGDMDAAIAFYSAAIERDSAYADAWAALADAWVWTSDNTVPNRMAMRLAKRAANRALRLDSANGLAWASLGIALYSAEYDWAGAERALRQGVARDPHNAVVRATMASLLGCTGRFNEAWQQIEAAWQRDSLNPRLGWFLYVVASTSRRDAELVSWSGRFTSSTAMGPFYRFFGWLAAGTLDSAVQHPGSFERALAYGARGQTGEARRFAAAYEAAQDSLRRLGEWNGPMPFDAIAAAWAAAGDRDRAFASLERALDIRANSWLPTIKYNRVYDSLRDDPRYAAILRRMNLEN